MHNYTKYAWGVSLASFAAFVILVRYRVLDQLSLATPLILVGALFCYCGASAVTMLRRGGSSAMKRASFWANVIVTVLWAAVIFGILTFPGQK